MRLMSSILLLSKFDAVGHGAEMRCVAVTVPKCAVAVRVAVSSFYR